MFIRPKSGAKSLWDFNERIAEEVLLAPKDEQVPCPWDADIEVAGDEVIIEGYMAPGGPQYGKCICTIPVSKFSDFFTLELPDSVVGDTVSEAELEALQGADWEIVR